MPVILCHEIEKLKRNEMRMTPRREVKAESPIELLLQRIDDVKVPPKSPEHIRAESVLKSALAERKVANEELRQIIAQYRAAEDGHTPTTSRPTRAALRAAEQRLSDADEKIEAARQALEPHLSRWRNEYAKAVEAEVQPLRAALHDQISQLDTAVTAIARLATKLSVLSVGSPWIVRNASGLIQNLRAIRDLIDYDRKLPS